MVEEEIGEFTKKSDWDFVDSCVDNAIPGILMRF